MFVNMLSNVIRFATLTSLGSSAYLDDSWPRILKFLHMSDFDTGLIACEGGKYM